MRRGIVEREVKPGVRVLCGQESVVVVEGGKFAAFVLVIARRRDGGSVAEELDVFVERPAPLIEIVAVVRHIARIQYKVVSACVLHYRVDCRR